MSTEDIGSNEEHIFSQGGGGDALSDIFTVSGSDGAGAGEVTGEGETGLAIALVVLSRKTSTAGRGGMGFTGPG